VGNNIGGSDNDDDNSKQPSACRVNAVMRALSPAFQLIGTFSTPVVSLYAYQVSIFPFENGNETLNDLRIENLGIFKSDEDLFRHVGNRVNTDGKGFCFYHALAMCLEHRFGVLQSTDELYLKKWQGSLYHTTLVKALRYLVSLLTCFVENCGGIKTTLTNEEKAEQFFYSGFTLSDANGTRSYATLPLMDLLRMTPAAAASFRDVAKAKQFYVLSSEIERLLPIDVKTLTQHGDDECKICAATLVAADTTTCNSTNMYTDVDVGRILNAAFFAKHHMPILIFGKIPYDDDMGLYGLTNYVPLNDLNGASLYNGTLNIFFESAHFEAMFA
jgi:hypothetical protein